MSYKRNEGKTHTVFLFLRRIAPFFFGLLSANMVFSVFYYLTGNFIREFFLMLLVEMIIFFLYVFFKVMTFSVPKDYEKEIDELQKRNSDLSYKYHQKKTDLYHYYLTWIHQIKTPITASKLMIESLEKTTTVSPETAHLIHTSLREQMLYIENYTNMALNYLKIIDEEADLYVERVCLDDLISQQLKKYALLFIRKRISLNYRPIKETVVTSAQWCGIMIEQILSNSLKYTEKGEITIDYDRKKRALTLSDTGMGIRSEDLQRIFERGYSGHNGALSQESSGIGLFLVKQISARLNIRIQVKSKIGIGTQTILYFPDER